MGTGELNIIRASAGSGKTYTLARTYITNLIGVPVQDDSGSEQRYKLRERYDYQNHILAITFTNKATNEMKQRIITQLYALSKGEGDYIDYFKSHFVYDSFEQVIEAARKSLCDILFHYGSFNVSTIDSFFQTILRNFARELDRDYNYELQLDEEYATQVAVHDFMLDLGGDNARQKAIDNWVKEYIINNISQNKTWDFFGNSENLEKFASNIYKEFFRDHHDEIVKYLEDIGNGKNLSRIAQFKKAVIRLQNFHDGQFKNSSTLYKAFFDSKGLPEESMKKNAVLSIYRGEIDKVSDKSINTTLRSYALSETSLVDKILLKAYQRQVDLSDCSEFQKLVTATIHHWDMMQFYKSVHDNLWNLGLLGKIDEKLEQYRKDTNSILIADTNDLISRVLQCGATFIYEHAGTKFHNYMIDEFQDTSRKQYENFTPLLKESCDTGNSNLIIGDEKQSIYRFRNSDPSLLRDEVEVDFRRFAHSSPLETNYRSLPSIVRFNNAVFERIINYFCHDESQYPSLKKTYQNIKQQVNSEGDDGLVRFNFVTPDGSASQLREMIIKCLPSYINCLRSRGFEMSDIAILVNRNDEGNDIVEHILQYNEQLPSDDDPRHINVVSSESLLLKNSPSVRLIISMLYFLEATQNLVLPAPQESDHEELINRFLDRRISLQKHYKVLHDFQSRMQNASLDVDPGEVLLECFDNEMSNESKSSAEKVAIYSSVAQGVMPDKNNQLTSLANIVDNIISKYVLPKDGGKSSRSIENSFILAFVSLVHDFCKQRNGGTICEFLEYWESKKDKLAVSSPGNGDAINVMTIHKSKGLEFKCVIIPFADWQLIKDDKLYWISREEWMGLNNSGKPIGENEIDDEEMLPPLIPASTTKVYNTSLFTTQIDAERERCLIDNINKLYVAFTRPVEELHVFAVDNSEKQKIKKIDESAVKTVSELILKVVPNISADGLQFASCPLSVLEPCDSVDESQLWEQISSLQLGVTSKRDDCVDDDVAGKWGKTLRMPNYRFCNKIMPVRVKVNTTSGYTDEGIRMHTIFSTIRSIDDVDRALRFAVVNGLFDGNKYWKRQQFVELVNSISTDELLASWFDAKNQVLNERTISSTVREADGTMSFNHYRPDRVVIRPGGDVLVIDYKFGYKNDSETMAAHSARVAKYMELMQQIMGSGHSVKGYLWYARHNSIVEVPLQ